METKVHRRFQQIFMWINSHFKGSIVGNSSWVYLLFLVLYLNKILCLISSCFLSPLLRLLPPHYILQRNRILHYWISKHPPV